MFNKEALIKELSGDFSKFSFAGKVSCVKILKRISKMSHLIKKCDRKDGDFKNNCYVYLADNYSRVEQTLKDDAHNLFYENTIRAKKFESAYLYAFYNYLKKNKPAADENRLTSFFETVNNCKNYPGLNDEINMLLYYRSALCLVIFDVFRGILKNGPSADDEKKLEELFCAYDVVLNYDSKKIFLSHPVEKVLFNDPAGLYDKLSESTKNSYRKNLEKMARRKRTEALDTARQIVALCQRESDYTRRHIGMYLCDKAVLGNVYIVMLVFLSILFTVLLCLVSPFFVVAFFGVFTSTRLLLDKIFGKFASSFTLPSLELENIPEKHGVIVVITSLLSGNGNDDELFSRLEMLYYLVRDKNVCFGLLCDLCDSENEFDENDRKIFENANEKIRLLREKYGEVFYLFLRERRYCECEQRYIAPERKRGAVASLTSFLCNKEDDFCNYSIKPSREECDNIKYVFTLDADTNIEFDCLKKAVGIMMHPQNIPVYDNEKNAVIRGYGIIQPGVVTTPKASNKNFFTNVLCGHGGISSYETGIVDGAMDYFARSIFVGKGMFEKNVFYKALCCDNAFKEQSILSHDAPEGARLRCAHVSSITLTDSFPHNELSYYKRLHRWIRGDIQNIPFLFKNVKTKNEGVIRNGIGGVSRLYIFENIKNAVLPVFTVFSLFCSLLFDGSTQILIITVSLSPYLLPFVYSVLSTVKKTFFHNYRRLFFSQGIYSGLVNDFLLCAFKIGALAKTAAVSLDAIIRSLYRMLVSKKHLLEWTTSAQNDAEKDDGLLGYVKKNILSALLGTLLYVNTDNSFLKLVGLLWFFMPYFSYEFSREKNNKRPVLNDERAKLMEYCRDMWSFFDENVGEESNHLPCDNISFRNNGKICNMTSPTNIGLYLASICVCEKIGLLSRNEALTRLEKTLDSVDKLPKHKGLLYNWYDIYKCTPMSPMYVSSVDEGNFIGCLYTVKGAVEEFEKTQESDRILKLVSRLIEESDLSFMYNKKRKLFYIGFTVTKNGCVFDKNCYDMLMSEARILSFVSVAQRYVTTRHYKMLSRRFVEGNGYLGLASWSGTMFEYFMPELFFESEKSTLLYEALSYAVHFSKRTFATRDNIKVYGISESCYNEIDNDGNYKYKAFGVKELAVDVLPQKLVISPYSSFLALGFDEYKALDNLENIKKIGGYGKYGFYESVDFDNTDNDGRPGIVKCFMSHHIGMSILACGNRLCDKTVCRWFFCDKNNLAFYSFTKEQIPYMAYVRKNAKKQYDLFFRIKQANTKKAPSGCAESTELCCNSLKVKANKDDISFLFDNLEMFKKNGKKQGLKVKVRLFGKEFDAVDGAAVMCSNSCVTFVKYPSSTDKRRFKTSLFVTLDKNTADIVRIKLKVEPCFDASGEKINCEFSFNPFLEDEKEGKCALFDNTLNYSLSVCQKDTLSYHNKNSLIYMYCSLFTKEDNRISVQSFVENKSTGVIIAQTDDIKDGFECELVFSVSYNERCAEIGIVRSRERDFETAARLLCEQNAALKNTRKNEKSSKVLGASVVKRIEKTHYPINTLQEDYKLLCGENFASVVLKDGLGFCFCYDARKGEVSRYIEKDGRMSSAEGVYFGTRKEFDLVKSAKETRMYPYMVQYEGIYFKDAYRVSVFVSASMPYKVVVVETTSQSPLHFCAAVSKKLCAKKEISGGVLFFSGKEQNSEKGFLTGVCLVGENAVSQAQLSYSCDDVCAFFDFYKGENPQLKKYIFTVGMAKSIDKAYLYQSTITKGYAEILKGADRLAKRLYINREKIPARLYQILSYGFVIPQQSCNFRSLVNTQSPVREFDNLLLVYTESNLKTQRILEGFMKNDKDDISKLLLYISLCEHTRLYHTAGLCERKINNVCLYRICAQNIIRMAKDIKNTKDDFVKKLYLYTFDRIMCLCRNMQDMPAYYKLCEIKKMFF